MSDCKITLGRMPRRMDRFAQVITAADPRLYLRFIEGGEGEGGDGGDGGDEGAQVEGLGDAGKQALDRMKSERNAARAEAKAFKDLGLTVDEIKALKKKPASSDDDVEKRIQKAIDAAKAEAKAESRATSDARTRAAEVRAQAAELGFIKPAQALALLDAKKLADVTVGDDGDADADAVKKLLEELKTDSPHLLKPTDTTADHRTAGIGSTGSATKADVRPGADRLRQAYANTTQ
jgi:hypothetical protein